jgi:hypothetical protein
MAAGALEEIVLKFTSPVEGGWANAAAASADVVQA